MSLPSGARTRFVPHKTLQEGWTYVSIPSDNLVIGVRVAVTKVMKILNQDGTEVKDAAGNPSFWFQSTNVVRVLTKDEYGVVVREGPTE